MAKRPMSTELYRYFGAYERVRQSLLDEPDHGRLDQTLGFWVQQADRRLPVAFLDRTLGSILECNLEQLLDTQGVGQKKIGGLLTLLKRAMETSSNGDFGMAEAGSRRRSQINNSKKTPFDPAMVSEELWAKWCDTVTRCKIGHLPLGQLAPTLLSLPTVIWQTPLSEYTNMTLEEMRSLKTYGEKRVHAILGVFSGAHELLATSMMQQHIEVSLKSKFISPIANWIVKTLESNKSPTAKMLHKHLAAPLTQQLEIDLGEQIAELAEARVSLSASAPSVREQSERLEVTRARIYQLLDDCGKAMQVRWPGGRWLLVPLGSLIALEENVETLAIYRSICDLFYPHERSTNASSKRKTRVTA